MEDLARLPAAPILLAALLRTIEASYLDTRRDEREPAFPRVGRAKVAATAAQGRAIPKHLKHDMTAGLKQCR
jgi:hypothetical protein